MVSRRKPRDGQTWRTFIKNHAKQIYACDYLTQYTAFFTVVYVFVVKESLRYRCHLDLWLADVIRIEGIPIPYGAPNASPYIERFNRTLREEALNHFIFLSARNILRVCREYVNYYNGARPSQATHAIPDPYPELRKPPPTTGRVIALPVLGGVQHDYRRVA